MAGLAREGGEAKGLGRGFDELLGPMAEFFHVIPGCAGELDKQLRIVGIGKEFGLKQARRRWCDAARFDELRQGPVNQRRVDWTAINSKHMVG